MFSLFVLVVLFISALCGIYYTLGVYGVFGKVGNLVAKIILKIESNNKN